MPRAGIGSVSIPPLVILERIGLFPGATEYVADAVRQLQRRRDKLIVDGGPAQQLARAIGPTMPIAYGGDALGGVAAYRFKCQVNENAKAPGVLRRRSPRWPTTRSAAGASTATSPAR